MTTTEARTPRSGATARGGTRAPGERLLLSVVVVNYGSSALLARNLAEHDPSGRDVRVVVVDNWSGAGERAAVRELSSRHGWHLVELSRNGGFGAGVNAGIATARELGCRAHLLVNPDAVVAPEVVEELRLHSAREPLAMISPQIRDSTGTVVFDGAVVDLADGRTRRCRAAGGPSDVGSLPWLTGACVVVHDDLLALTGGFDEPYFLYWEDVDLSWRCLQVGGRLVVRRDLVARHDEGGTHGASRGRAKSGVYYRYNCRNRLLFAARHLTRFQVLRWVLHTPSASWDILMRGGRRQLLSSPGLLVEAARGSLAGIFLALGAALGPRAGRAGDPAVSRPRLLVAHPGAELYGSDRVLLDSVRALRAAADVVVTLPVDGPLRRVLEDEGVTVVVQPAPVLRKSAAHPLGLLRLAITALRSLPAACSLIRSAGRDGLYVSTLTLPGWLVLGRLLGRRVVCHVHEAESSAPRWLRWVLALPVRAAGTVVVNSRFSESVLLASAPSLAARTTVLDNPVPGPAAPEPARAALTGPVRLLFVGRLSPRKGPQMAVLALAELVRRGIDARLSLLGSAFPGYEWFERELEELVAREGLTDRVEHLGFRAEVFPHLEDCDVVLIPSQVDEPFGNTAVEAVLAARPVVVSATSGLLEAAQGYASVRRVAPSEPGAWADAVEELVDRWPAVRREAVADAAAAGDRHAPERYATALRLLVLPSLVPPSLVPVPR